MADRVLLIAVCYRTNLTLRQVALLFGLAKPAAHRVVDHLAPLLALAPVTGQHAPKPCGSWTGCWFPSTIERSPPRPRTTGTR
ncbi:transposase family protein [Actinomadura sp. NPDC048021]|uniref:transposase family protein n=1 Tax=Actinomadura sp. NPDC048021 TaxID=3155385 RepID=UPI0033DE4DED